MRTTIQIVEQQSNLESNEARNRVPSAVAALVDTGPRVARDGVR
jgi:hypothetical protein